MQSKQMKEIFAASRTAGWVLEPRAKELLAAAGMPVPRFTWAHDQAEATRFADAIGYPVVAKVISPAILHKSDAGGVIVDIKDASGLAAAYDRLKQLQGFAGMLVEEMVEGMELIIGAKVDLQFGPVILLGIGGTSVEIYQDTSIRMAPLQPKDVEAMVHGLRAHQLLEGFRGAPPINRQALIDLLMAFSALVMETEAEIESIDLNPIKCTAERCLVADARIMLAEKEGKTR
jgi:acyl-CoA synthetase (NDP forming)